MLYTYRFRLYPNKEQEVLLQKHFGCCRFIYNYLLWFRQLMYDKTKKSFPWGESQAVIAKLKKFEEYAWLKEVNSQSLQFSHSCLKKAYEGFFEKRNGFPKRKKKLVKSFAVPQNVSLEETDSRYDKLIIPKFLKGIKIRVHRKVEGEIRSTSVVQGSSGEYYANILVDRSDFARYPHIEGEVGIDLGLTYFIVKDNGEKIAPPKSLQKMERKLAHVQRKLSTKRKGGSNYEKQRHIVAVLHRKVKNQRNNFLHVQSSTLISENQVIYIEDLHTAGMIRNHCLAKAIADASWSKFITYVTYKAAWHGRKIIFIDRFAPTSKLCSKCGKKNSALKLSDRVWNCKICHTEHDRDINAAMNIKKLGQGMSKVKPEERTAYTISEKRLQAGSRKQEPFSN